MTSLIEQESKMYRLYKIVYSDSFFEELDETIIYISDVLYDFKAAYRLINKVEKMINKLQLFPRLFQRFCDTDYRRIVIDNFIIIYIVDDLNRVVQIRHFYYTPRKSYNL